MTTTKRTTYAMRCNRCHRLMPGTTAYDGACECGGLIEATPVNPKGRVDLAARLSAADRRASAGYVAPHVKQSFNRAARAYLRVVLAELLPLLDQDWTMVSYNPGGIAIRGEVTCCMKFKGVDLGVYLHVGSFAGGRDLGYWRFSIPSRDPYGAGAAALHRNRWIESKMEPEQLAFEIADAARRELDPRFFVASAQA